MEHLEELLLQQSNPVAKAEYFGVLFDQLPTYAEIKYGTQNPIGLTGINELFKLKNCPQGALVRSTRLRWNSLYPSIEKLHLRLEELGCIEHNGQIIVVDHTEEKRNV